MKKGLLLGAVIFGCMLIMIVLSTQRISVAEESHEGEEVEQTAEEMQVVSQEAVTQENVEPESVEQEPVDEEEEEMEHPGEITFEKPIKAVFDHQIHMDAGNDCDSCHDEIFEMETGAAEATGEFNMAAFRDGKYCGVCHDGDTAFYIYEQCDTCHFPPEETIYFTQPVLAVKFDHKVHVGREKIECEECHKKVFTMKRGRNALNEDFVMSNIYCEGADVKYCGICHNNKRAFADNTRCTVCHIGSREYNKIMAERAGKKADTHKKGH